MASSNPNTFFGSRTKVSETCLWIAEGYRRICVSYEYDAGQGVLKYASSIYRCERCDLDNKYIEITEEMMDAHDHTTTRRFELRPVIIAVQRLMSYADIIKTIRYDMCHGYGCKGPRGLPTAFGTDAVSDDGANSKSSANDWESDNKYYHEKFMEYYKTFDKLHTQRKTPRTLRYISHSSHENYMGVSRNVMREFFIAFKACKRTGALIYAAAISRRPEELGPITDKYLVDNHFKTAIYRLEQCPVPMIVSEEYRHQLKKNATHREDVMYEILDKIHTRPGGKYLIRGFGK